MPILSCQCLHHLLVSVVSVWTNPYLLKKNCLNIDFWGGTEGVSLTLVVTQKKYCRVRCWDVYLLICSGKLSAISIVLGSEFTDGSTLLITLIMDDKVKAISLPMLHFLCMCRWSCSEGSHLP
jgi:hypothetical protein